MATVPIAKAVDKLERPAGMYHSTWKHLQAVLRALTKYLPDPFPSQRELARRVHLDQRTVGRLLERAEELGLIARTPRVTPAGHQSYSYALLFEANREANASEKTSSSPSEKNRLSYGPSAEKNPPPRRANRWGGDCDVCGFRVQARQGWLHSNRPVHRECDEGVPNVNRKFEQEHQFDLDSPDQIGEDPTVAPRGATVVTDPAARLVGYFQDVWFGEALRTYPAWRDHRVIHVGAAIGYVRSIFLARDYSPEHVEAYIDAFYEELLFPGSDLDLHEGQTPWQLFTTWWGRTSVPDPAIARARDEELATIARIAGEKRALVDAATARIFALADDEVGDPADYRLAGLPMPVEKRRTSG